MIDAEYEKTFRSYADRIHLSGFRQGKVPRHILVQRFGKEIEQDVVETLIRNCSLSAIREKGLEPLHSPVLKDLKFERDTGLSFVAEFEVRPELEVAGYRDIHVERRAVEVSEGEIAKAIDDLRVRAARYDGVEGRGVAQGDFVLAGIRGTFDEGQGEPISRPDAFFEVGSAGPHPELTDELKGMEPGQERTFAVRYPADHPSAQLAGRKVAFRVALREIKSRTLPELNDDFAREVGAGTTLDELRAKVRDELMRVARSKERSEAVRKAIDQLLSANPRAEAPESMVDEQVEGYVEDLMRAMQAQGIDPAAAGVDLERVRSEQREMARRSVVAGLLLDAIARKESLEIAAGAVDEALEHEARQRRQNVGSLRARWEKEGRVDALKRHLLREKVLDLVLGTANT